MPSITAYVFIGACRGFRPCVISYNPPALGSNGDYQIIEVADKFELKGVKRIYDKDATASVNDLNKIIGDTLRLKQDGPELKPKKGKKPLKPKSEQTEMFQVEPPKPLLTEEIEDLPF